MNRSQRALVHPEISDNLKLALHRAWSAPYRVCDLFDSMAFHSPHRNLAQIVDSKKFEKSLTLFCHLGG